MIAVMRGFITALRTLPPVWQIWVLLLFVVNAVAPLAFLGTIEAKVAIVAVMLGGAIMMVLFRYLGFVRLMGLGHIIPWTPLVIWLWTRLPPTGAAGAFGKWMILVIVVNSLSLVVDYVDVVRYIAGDRKPTMTMADVT